MQRAVHLHVRGLWPLGAILLFACAAEPGGGETGGRGSFRLDDGSVLFETSFDDDALERSERGGDVRVSRVPEVEVRDPLSGQPVTVGGHVAELAHDGRGIAYFRIPMRAPESGVAITAWVREACVPGDTAACPAASQVGDGRLFASQVGAEGEVTSASVGSVPPRGGSHYEVGRGHVPDDPIGHFAILPFETFDPVPATPIELPWGPGPRPDLGMAALPTGIRRTPGWHRLRLLVTPHGTFAEIDGVLVHRDMANHRGAAPWASHLRGATHFGFATTASSGVPTRTFVDRLEVRALPSPPSMRTLASAQIDAFVATYGGLADAEQLEFVRSCASYLGATPPPPDYLRRAVTTWYSYAALAAALAVHHRLHGDGASLARALAALRAVLDHHQAWRLRSTHDWISHIGLPVTLMAATLLWPLPELSAGDRDRVRALAIEETDRAWELARHGWAWPSHGYYEEVMGNSSSEEIAWGGGPYPYLLVLFPDDPRVPEWRERLAHFAERIVADGASGPADMRTVWDEALSRDVAVATDSAGNPLFPEYRAIACEAGSRPGECVRRRGYDPRHLLDNHHYHPHPSYGRVAATPGMWELLLARSGATATPPLTSDLQVSVSVRMLSMVDPETFRYRGDEIHRLPRACERDAMCARSGDAGIPCHVPLEGLPFGARSTCEASGFSAATDNVFREAGLDDWGADGLDVAFLLALRHGYRVQAYVDPATGERRDVDAELARAVSFAHYTGALAPRVPAAGEARFVEPGAPPPDCADVLDARRPGTVAYRWERLSMPWLGLGWFLMYDTP